MVVLENLLFLFVLALMLATPAVLLLFFRRRYEETYIKGFGDYFWKKISGDEKPR